MKRRRAHAACLAAILSGCTSPGSVPRVNLYGMTLPRFEMFRYGVPDTPLETTPHTLTAAELTDIKTDFSSEFQDGRTLEFGPIAARRQSAGSLVVCGLVNIRTPAGTTSGMTLFDGVGSHDTASGRLGFTPRRVAGANAKTLDIYSDCRDAGVL